MKKTDSAFTKWLEHPHTEMPRPIMSEIIKCLMEGNYMMSDAQWYKLHYMVDTEMVSIKNAVRLARIMCEHATI